MKKVSKILAGLISTVTIFSSLLILNTKLNKEVKYDDFHESVETLDSIFEGDSRPHKLEPKKAYEGDSLLEPIVKVQISDLSAEGKRSIRFVAAIPDLNLSAKFVRTMYDEEGVAFKETKEYQVSEAYTSIIAGNSKVYPSAFGEGYQYFVTYTMSNVPNDYWYHALDVDLVLEARNEDNQLLESNGSNEANVEGLMTDYYESTYNYTELEDGTYEVSVKEEKKKDKNQKRYELGNHKNERDEHKPNVAKRGKEVTSIAENGFSGCEYMTDLILPKYIKEIKDSAFEGCTEFVNLFFKGEIEDWLSIQFSGSNSNPLLFVEQFFGKNNQSLENIVIPSSVTEINDYAFYNAKAIKSVTFEEGSICTRIGEYAFAGCEGLTSLVIPNSITEMGFSALANCNNLGSLTLPFAGQYLDGTGSTHFGYIFGASSYSYNKDFVPDSLKTVELTNCLSLGNYALYKCEYINSIVLPSNLISIGDYCFKSISIREIEILNNVEKIGLGAFEGCTLLKKITLPFVGQYSDGSGLSHFGYIFGASDYGYNNSYIPKNLEEVILTNCNFLKDNAFYSAENIQTINISGTIEEISTRCFYYCLNLKNVVLSDSIIKINDYAFYCCRSLVDIILPSNLVSIESYVFENCTSLRSINIPSSVTKIGTCSFSQCETLEDIMIPEGVTKISQALFYRCRNLKEIILPSTITSIDNYAFSGCESLEKIILPSQLLGISQEAFSRCSSLKSIEIPEKVTSIGGRAFDFCSSLTNIYIPSNVSSIGDSAFYYCENLKEINVNENNKFYSSFEGNLYNKNMTLLIQYAIGNSRNEFIIPSTVKNIKSRAFENNEYLTNIILSDNMVKIDDYAFCGCKGLVNINISENITSIGSYAFSGCKSLENINIPEYVKSIGNGVFSGCVNLIDVTLPESIEIKDSSDMFAGCEKLTSISLPSTITSIGSYAFSDCISLTTITIPSSVTSIDSYSFYGCKGLTNIEIPSLVTNIGRSAFEGCKSLINMIIPNGVTNIALNAFYNCGLLSVYIPKSVINIGNYAFYNCDQVIIYCESESQLSGWAKNWYYINRPIYYNILFEQNFIISNDIHFLISNDRAIVTRYTGNKSEVVIPSFIKFNDNNYNVEEIGTYAFVGCKNLKNVKFPETINKFNKGIFLDCQTLESITLPFIGENYDGSGENYFVYLFGATKYNESHRVPQSLKDVIITKATKIHDYAFYDCQYISNVELPTSLLEIGNRSFSNCYRLLKINIPEGVIRIGKAAFSSCIRLTDVTFPSTLKEVGDSAFLYSDAVENIYITDLSSWCEIILNDYYCIPNGNLYLNNELVINLVIPEGVSHINDYAFSGFTFSNLYISEGVTSIGANAFYECGNLVNVVISKGMKNIGNMAFYNCSKLTNISFPSTLENIEDNVFGNCYSLSKVNIEDIASWCNLTLKSGNSNPIYYSKSLYLNNELITDLIIPEGVTVIKNNVFMECRTIKSVTFPSTLTSIENNAFYFCSGLDIIIIPLSVTSIGESAFSGSSSLKIYCESKTKPNGWHSSWLSSYSAKIYWGDKWEYVDGVPTPII